VARGEHLRAVQRNGIVIETGEERIVARVRASDRPSELGHQDFVISTLKANSLAALATGVAPLLGADTGVVFAQNGIPWWYPIGLAPDSPTLRMGTDLSFLDPGRMLATAIATKRIIGATVYSANAMLSPGVIHNSSPKRNQVYVDEVDGRRSDRIVALREALASAAIESPEVADLRQELWQKVAWNIATGATVLVEEPTSDMMADPSLAALAKRLMEEVVAIAKAHGMALKPLMPSVPIGKKASILQDYEAERPMEIDAQFRAPLAFAKAAHVDAPVLETVAALIAHRAASKGLYQRA